MLRRPPRSTRTDTLLPYTTLFRSCHSVATRGAVRKACRGCNPDLRLPPLPQGFRCVAVAVVRHRKIKSSSLRSRPHPPSGHLAPRPGPAQRAVRSGIREKGRGGGSRPPPRLEERARGLSRSSNSTGTGVEGSRFAARPLLPPQYKRDVRPT